MKKDFLRLVAAVAVFGSLAVGCKKKEETAALPPPADVPVAQVSPVAAGARVERITVAKAVNADDSPGAAATTFAKGDTVYVSMWTASAPVGTEITARWFGPDGQQVTEDKIVTDRPGDGYTSFHAANVNGWAPGTYRVEILVNGAPAGSTTFTVG
jgi:hypothetical protein